MKLDRAIELMKIELKCVSNDCDRDCYNCDLVQDVNELKEAYNTVINKYESEGGK